ncbi:hypothetical protein [Streptomyces sp. NPDC002889]
MIVQLQTSGWAERRDGDSYPDPEDRARMLATTLEDLREYAPPSER